MTRGKYGFVGNHPQPASLHEPLSPGGETIGWGGRGLARELLRTAQGSFAADAWQSPKAACYLPYVLISHGKCYGSLRLVRTSSPHSSPPSVLSGHEPHTRTRASASSAASRLGARLRHGKPAGSDTAPGQRRAVVCSTHVHSRDRRIAAHKPYPAGGEIVLPRATAHNGNRASRISPVQPFEAELFPYLVRHTKSKKVTENTTKKEKNVGCQRTANKIYCSRTQ